MDSKGDISDRLDRWVLGRRRRGIDPPPLPAGVTEHKGRYQARARVAGKTAYLGTFATPEAAGAAVAAAVAARPAAPKRRPGRAPGRGVYRTHHGRWEAKFKRGDVMVWVGTFATEEEAAAAVAARRGEVADAEG